MNYGDFIYNTYYISLKNISEKDSYYNVNLKLFRTENIQYEIT